MNTINRGDNTNTGGAVTGMIAGRIYREILLRYIPKNFLKTKIFVIALKGSLDDRLNISWNKYTI